MRTPDLLLAAMLGGVMACGGPDVPRLIDTGWFDDATVGEGCQDKLEESEPEDGAVDWYWRYRPSATTTTDRPGRYQAWLTDEDQVLVPAEPSWADDDPSFEMDWAGWLTPETAYTFSIKDCVETHEISFTTSSYGLPLERGPATVVGNTYRVELSEAQWVVPATLGPLVRLYLNDPILMKVHFANDAEISMWGAPGQFRNGELLQDTTVPTWDFGFADFSEQPFFDVRADQIVLQYRLDNGVTAIPVENFVFQGTFSPDGQTIGGGVLAGRADTREIGETLQAGNQAYFCDLAGAQGVSCVACADGELLCLDLVAESVEATVQPTLDLVFVAE